MNMQLFRAAQVSEFSDLLRRGEIGAFPTDTVYGVAAHPTHPDSIARLFKAKRRPLDKAIPILLADIEGLEQIAESPGGAAIRLAERFWPGALTIVLRRRKSDPDDPPTVAVRIPSLEIARDIIRQAGGLLAVTSANISGGLDCITAAQVVEQLGGRIDGLLDGGTCPGGVSSTVVDATLEPVRILRQGGTTLDALREVVDIAG